MAAINVLATLKAAGIDRLVKRTVRQHADAGVVYLVVELRDGQWGYVEHQLVPSSFDAIFVADEAAAIARAPTPVRRVWG